MKRLENGLVEGINYTRDENGRIEWFKLIPRKYLYINTEKKAQIEKRLGKRIDEADESEFLDTDYVINLQGIKYLLDLRGYQSCKTRIDECNPDYAAATCEITFIPNDEDNFPQTYTACASAHPQNTKSWYAKYLVEASSNRALCRAVRQFLRINAVAQEELGGAGGGNNDDEPVNPMGPLGALKNLMTRKGKTLVDIKALSKDLGHTTEITTLNDVTPKMAWDLIDKL